MLQLISKTTAIGPLTRYVSLLDKMGYVKSSLVKRLLLYTFLLDFVEHMHPYITEKDYKLIDKVLGKTFNNGNCLLPYPVFCVRRATLGKADYMGDIAVRVTEVEGDERITEDGDIRTA